MKDFIILHGPMGVGKSTVSRHLCQLLQPSALLEGDWCWKIYPFCPNEEYKNLALKHMTYLLDSYLHVRSISYLIFNWMIQDDKIFEKILPFLDLTEINLHRFALLCDEKSLEMRLKQDVFQGLRDPDCIDRGLSYLPFYENTKSQILDTTLLSPHQVAQQIANQILFRKE